MINAFVNAAMVLANLKKLPQVIDTSDKKARLDTAYEVLRLSQMEVPHDEGTLQNSGTVEEMPDGDIITGYHTPYAARLHEHPEYDFQKGRKGKFLEDPINRNTETLGLAFLKSMTDGMKEKL